MSLLLYIHGFNSSPQSWKARALGEWLEKNHPEIRFEVPYLKPYPADSIRQLRDIIEAHPGEQIGLVGSSLGGFYASWLVEHYDLRAVLVNPSVRPFELLRAYLGENRNFYNDDAYLFEEKHVEELLAINTPIIQRPGNYLLMVQTGDETLNFREATAKYCHAENIIEWGGDHGFSNFDRWFSYILRFLKRVD